MLVIAAKISLFHVFKKLRCTISKMINPTKATMAKMIPIMSRSLAGKVSYLIFCGCFHVVLRLF